MALDSLIGTPSLTEQEHSLNRDFLTAATAVAQAYAEGRLTDEEADGLLRLVTALTVQARVNTMVNRFTERMSASYLSDKRIGGLFDSAMKS